MSQDLTRLSTDARGIPLQVGLFPNGSRHVAYGTTNGVVCTTLDAGVAIVEITTTTAAMIGFGSGGVTPADGFFQAANFPRQYAIRDQTQITVVAATGALAGTFHLTQFK